MIEMSRSLNKNALQYILNMDIVVLYFEMKRLSVIYLPEYLLTYRYLHISSPFYS